MRKPQVIRQIVVQQAPQPKWSKGVAGVLSFLIPGLGQIYKGKPISGLFWFCLVVVGYMFLLVPGLCLHFICVIAACSGDPYR